MQCNSYVFKVLHAQNIQARGKKIKTTSIDKDFFFGHRVEKESTVLLTKKSEPNKEEKKEKESNFVEHI